MVKGDARTFQHSLSVVVVFMLLLNVCFLVSMFYMMGIVGHFLPLTFTRPFDFGWGA